jgi:hypothetical protein
MTKIRLVICIDNEDYPASLERRKIYQVVPDEGAESAGQVRVIEESGEDYLYPVSCFVDAVLSEEVTAAVVRVACLVLARAHFKREAVSHGVRVNLASSGVRVDRL